MRGQSGHPVTARPVVDTRNPCPVAGDSAMRDQWSRRSVLGAAACAVWISPLVACSHDLGRRRTPRIGFMIGNGYPEMVAAFRDELRRLGYVEGDNLILESRFSTAASDLRAQAAELGGMDLELIVAAALPQALAIRAANPAMRMVVGTAAGTRHKRLRGKLRAARRECHRHGRTSGRADGETSAASEDGRTELVAGRFALDDAGSRWARNPACRCRASGGGIGY